MAGFFPDNLFPDKFFPDNLFPTTEGEPPVTVFRNFDYPLTAIISKGTRNAVISAKNRTAVLDQ
jgi:hypothetical protein